MIRRPLTSLAVALAGAALIAGCGGGGSTTSSTSSTAAASKSTPTATSSTPTTTSTPTTSSAPSGTAVQQAVVACKHAIQAQTTLPARAKGKLEAVCDKAAKGDTTAVRKVAQEVCSEVINSSAVPPGPAREQAIAACKSK
jgi:hypothetical protein